MALSQTICCFCTIEADKYERISDDKMQSLRDSEGLSSIREEVAKSTGFALANWKGSWTPSSQGLDLEF